MEAIELRTFFPRGGVMEEAEEQVEADERVEVGEQIEADPYVAFPPTLKSSFFSKEELPVAFIGALRKRIEAEDLTERVKALALFDVDAPGHQKGEGPVSEKLAGMMIDERVILAEGEFGEMVLFDPEDKDRLDVSAVKRHFRAPIRLSIGAFTLPISQATFGELLELCEGEEKEMIAGLGEEASSEEASSEKPLKLKLTHEGSVTLSIGDSSKPLGLGRPTVQLFHAHPIFTTADAYTAFQKAYAHQSRQCSGE